MTVRKGPVETATRSLVASLGTLTARQKVTAAAAFKLAANLDDEIDGSKASALSRELRIVCATLTPAASAVPIRAQSQAHADPVQALQDQLAARRKSKGA